MFGTFDILQSVAMTIQPDKEGAIWEEAENRQVVEKDTVMEEERMARELSLEEEVGVSMNVLMVAEDL